MLFLAINLIGLGFGPLVVGMLSDWLEQLPAPPKSPTRTAEPHRELRAAMRLSAFAGKSFELPPQAPPRLFAEMAFEEAELTALRLPEAASRLFLAAAIAYRVAGDRIASTVDCMRGSLGAMKKVSGISRAPSRCPL